MFFGNLAFEGRHYRLKSFNDLRTRVQDRIANILVISCDCASAGEMHIFAVDAFKFGTALLWSACVA